MAQARAPALGHAHSRQQGAEQAEIADAELDVIDAGDTNGFQRQAQNFYVGSGVIRRGEQLDARLAEFARVRRRAPARLEAEGRAVVAEPRRCFGIRVALQVDAAGGQGQVGAQAQLLALLIGEDVGARAQALADDIEEEVGRLDDRRRHALISAFREDAHDARGLSLQRFKLLCGFGDHGLAAGTVAIVVPISAPRSGDQQRQSRRTHPTLGHEMTGPARGAPWQFLAVAREVRNAALRP